jgi:hypothetical protein
VSAVLVNIAIGLATSIFSGGGVWLWQRARNSSALRRKAAFFGIEPGRTCLIVLNHKHSSPGSTAHSDVHALIEAAGLAMELGSKVSVKSCDDVFGNSADGTEICIGGPYESNPRTAGHLAAYLPGARMRPHSTQRDSLALVVGNEQFRIDKGTEEYALVAKFTPPNAGGPVILVCGQTSVTNRAAVHFLKRDYRELMKSLPSTERFCLILRIVSSKVYGHEMVRLERDVTREAFVDPPAEQRHRPADHS